MSAVIEVRDLVVEYQAGGFAVRPIDGLSMSASAGELVILLGPSGCGKTSLLSAIGGLLAPAAGAVLFDGTPVHTMGPREIQRYRQEQVGFVFQAFNLVPSMSARENVAIGPLLAGRSRSSALARADVLLDRVGLAEQASRRPGRLSGGQQQRVAIARALAADPAVVLADEPTANLDYVHAEGVIRLLRDLRDDGRVVIVSTHDERLARVADTVIHLVPDAPDVDVAPAELTFPAGHTLFEMGERGDEVYVVLDGEVDIVRRSADGEVVRLMSCGPGEYFGELGPLLGFPRSATAIARTPVRVRTMGVSDFRREFQATPVQ